MARCGWPAGCDIWVDGFTDFTPQQSLVLRRLLELGNDVTVALTCDSLEGEADDIFAPSRRTAHALLRLAALTALVCVTAALRRGSGEKA